MIVIPATQDRYAEILGAVMTAVAVGGKVIGISSQELQDASSEQRKAAQNDLMWVWNGQISKHTGLNVKEVHGGSKLDKLLPLYKSWGGAALKRADYIQNILDHLPEFKFKVAVSYDMIRTKNLSVKRMAEYLSEMQKEAAFNGLTLESSSDLEFKSLMAYADEVK